MPRPSVQLATGARFGRWTVIRRQGRSTDGKLLYLCRCDCGTEREILPRTLRLHQSRSCGCITAEVTGARSRTHGLRQSAEYRVWSHMKGRCNNPTDDSYPDYGGRGISVCPRWNESFSAFYADMGQRPSPRHEIDRIDNDGPYEPTNCRWLLRARQALNRRSTRTLTYHGETLSIAEWVRRTGIPTSTILNRLKAGCSPEQVLHAIPHGGRPHGSVNPL